MDIHFGGATVSIWPQLILGCGSVLSALAALSAVLLQNHNIARQSKEKADEAAEADRRARVSSALQVAVHLERFGLMADRVRRHMPEGGYVAFPEKHLAAPPSYPDDIAWALLDTSVGADALGFALEVEHWNGMAAELVDKGPQSADVVSDVILKMQKRAFSIGARMRSLHGVPELDHDRIPMAWMKEEAPK